MEEIGSWKMIVSFFGFMPFLGGKLLVLGRVFSVQFGGDTLRFPFFFSPYPGFIMAGRQPTPQPNVPCQKEGLSKPLLTIGFPEQTLISGEGVR